MVPLAMAYHSGPWDFQMVISGPNALRSLHLIDRATMGHGVGAHL